MQLNKGYWQLLIPFLIGGVLTAAVLLYMTRNRSPILLHISPPDNSRVGSYEVTFDAEAVDPEGADVQYHWDFGDGHISSEQRPKHHYTQGGEYIVTLTISDPQGAKRSTRIRIYVNRPPKAFASARPLREISPLAVQFDGSQSTDPDDEDQQSLKYFWDFGDGATSDLPEPVHHYASSGEYLVTLVVTDADGAVARTQIQVLVPMNQPPVARFQLSPTQPFVGDTVTFDARASYDPDGEIVLYEWDFDSDDRVDAYGAQVTRRFGQEGQYLVKLTVTDDRQESHSTVTVVQIAAPLPPVARFTFSPEVPNVNEVVNFDASDSLSPQSRITRFEWDLDGDGTIDHEGPRIFYRFTSGGRHEVTVTVTDQRGQQGRLSRIIQVNHPPVVRLATSPSAPHVNEDVMLDASGSYDPDGRITQYAWDLDADGNPERITAIAQLNYSFSRPGRHQIIVTATDDRGGINSARLTLEIRQPKSRIFLSGGIGTIGSLHLYKAALGIPVGKNILAELGYGQGEGQLKKRDYFVDVKLSAAELYLLYQITPMIFVGAGAGVLMIQGIYEIDWPVLGSTSFTRWLPTVGLKVGFQWGIFMFSVGVGYLAQ